MSDPLAALLDLPGVTAAAAEARAEVDRLLGHRILRRESGKVSAESALRGARASAALAGASYQLEAVRGGGVDDPVLTGALRVSAGLGALVDTWSKAPLQVLARLHVLAASGQVPVAELGRPAPTPEVTARLTGLVGLLAAQTSAPAAVVAAVVHGELLVVAPFTVANGVVSRAASRLTMITRGLDPKAVSVPEVGHVELGRAYDSALAGYRDGGPDGVVDWVRHCCAAMGLGAREGLAVCEAILRG